MNYFNKKKKITKCEYVIGVANKRREEKFKKKSKKRPWIPIIETYYCLV